MSVRLERRGRGAVLWIDKPPLNILDLATIAALDAALGALAAEPEPPLLVLRGAGGRAFSAGVSVHDHTPDKVEAMLRGFHAVVRAVDAYPAVTIAAVDGHCLGGGLELAMVCDLVVASERSRFGQPEIDLGCFAPVAAALYPRLLGAPRAHDLLLTGRILASLEAERAGLLSRRVPDGEFEAAAGGLVDALLAKSAPVLALSKKALRAGREHTFHDALDEAERIYLTELTALDDMREGTQAFLERRSPRWKQR
jgi:cyclohexa-1,5-dienecarbonyl-CoA hydratase